MPIQRAFSAIPAVSALQSVFLCLVITFGVSGGGCMVIMPGKSYRGPLPALTDSQNALAEKLRGDVAMLAETLGERNVWRNKNYLRAADWIEKRFADAGYAVSRQKYGVEGHECYNIVAERTGTTKPGEIVVIGAHYDSVRGTVGANDNASGVAALLALAESFKSVKPTRTVRFVAFTNEEPPFFQTEQMGSLVYARSCRERGDNVTAMLAFDGLGFYSDAPNSQSHPPPLGLFYPSTANYICFVGNAGSLGLLRSCVGEFRKHAMFPSEGGAGPQSLPGIGWSDHWSFWQAGYKGVMVTDSLPYRYRHYHTDDDTPDKLDYERMARVVEGLGAVIGKLAGRE